MSTSRQIIDLGALRVKAAHRRAHGEDIHNLMSGFNPAKDLHPSLFKHLANTAAETEEWRLEGEILIRRNSDCRTLATCNLKIRRLFRGCDITYLIYDPIFHANLALAVRARLEILMPDKFHIDGKPRAVRIFSGSVGYSQTQKKSPSMNLDIDRVIAAGFDTLTSHALLSFRAQTAKSDGDKNGRRDAKGAGIATKGATREDVANKVAVIHEMANL